MHTSCALCCAAFVRADAGKVAPEDAGPAAKSDAAGATKTYTARDWHSVIAAAKAEKNLWNGTAEKVNGPQL